MARKSLGFTVPPTLAIAAGATTPDPGGSGAAGSVAWSSSTGTLVQWNGSAWVTVGTNIVSQVVLGADLTNSTTTLADATGLSFAVKSGVTYRFRFYVVFQTAATTTGITLSVNGPASPTTLAYAVDIPTSATARTLGNRRAYDVASTGTAVDVINSNLLALIEGIIVPSADGTLIVRFASEVGASNAVIKAGSHGQIVVASASSGAMFDNAPLNSRSVTATTDTLVLGDIGKDIQCTNAADQTITVPPNSSVPYPVGTTILLTQLGAGQIILSPGSGVTLSAYSSPASFKSAGQYAVISLKKIATNQWIVAGQYQ